MNPEPPLRARESIRDFSVLRACLETQRRGNAHTHSFVIGNAETTRAAVAALEDRVIVRDALDNDSANDTQTTRLPWSHPDDERRKNG